MILTALFWKASARFLAPSSPILLSSSSSVASVYIKNDDATSRSEQRVTLTALFCNASATYFAPSSPTLFLLRLSLVSVCEKKCRCNPEKWTKNDVYSVITQSNSQTLNSFRADLIISNSKCGKCLWETLTMQAKKIDEKDIHSIITQCVTQILRSIRSNSIRSQQECRKCLWQRNEHTNNKDKENNMFTAFLRKALARCWTPSAPIPLSKTSSVVSVCAI
jgi:hypothetical protein